MQHRGLITSNQVDENKEEVPKDLQEDAIPYQVKKTKPFIINLKKILIFLKTKLKEKNLLTYDPNLLMNDIYIATKID